MPRVILGVKLYTMQETADLLGVTKNSITKYCQKKRIASTIIGGKKLFSEDNIRDFLQKSE